MSSMEERVEDIYKSYLDHLGITYYTKTEALDPRTNDAFKKYPSKDGGKGSNRPDIKYWRDGKPVVVEVKGKPEDLRACPNGYSIAFKDIKKYAVEGAIHYAHAILAYAADDYPEVIAIAIAPKYNREIETIDDLIIIEMSCSKIEGMVEI